jgi:hypothetical protein
MAIGGHGLCLFVNRSYGNFSFARNVADKNIHQLMDDLYALTAQVQSYEQKYGLLSPDFYGLYQAGHLDTGENLRDVTLWAGAYEMKLKLEKTIHGLSQQRLF